MTYSFKIPRGIPDLTNHIKKRNQQNGFHDVNFKGILRIHHESSPVFISFMKFRNRHDDLAITGDRLRQKIKGWARLQHEHVLPLFGLFYGYGPLPGLVTPWMENGNLIEFLDGHHKTLTRYERFRMLEDIASAVQYLHATAAVVNGNLSSSNIFVDSYRRAFVMPSTILDEIAESETHHIKTHLDRAQRVASVTDMNNPSGQFSTSKCDVWSFGWVMILSQMLCGKVTWSDVGSNRGSVLVKDDEPPIPQGIEENDSYFLRRCLSSRPANRPSADQVLAFVRGELLRCISGPPRATVGVRDTRNGIPDVMSEFRRHVFHQLPSYLIYIPEMRVVSRHEVIKILKPETITDKDLPKYDGWTRQSAIEAEVENMLKYAILSHRWGELEPTFQDLRSENRGPVYRLMNGMQNLRTRRSSRSVANARRAGCEKLHEFCRKAKEYGCLLAWSDTCCINKESSSELDEAIGSMYRWYRDAYICIVYLAQSNSLEIMHKDEWFFRSWTLQELIAPARMRFYGSNWAPFTHNENDKDDAKLALMLSKITNIPPNDLCNFRPGPNRVWEKMTWAMSRSTTRIEDVAYSLLGIFDINMTVTYGEGERVFMRFMAKLIHKCKEWQVLVWVGGLPSYPTEPACYCTSNEVALNILKNRHLSWWDERRGDSNFTVTKGGVQVRLLMIPATVHQTLGQSTFVSWSVDGAYSPLRKLVVQYHSFPPESTTEWMIGIVNYHGHRRVDKGRLWRGESYVCFLLRRLRRPGTDAMRNYWRREVTEDILTVGCVHDLEQILETVWL